MRLEGFMWLIIGGILSLLAIHFIVIDIVRETATFFPGFGFFLGFVAFFFIGLGLMMIIKEVNNSA